MGNPIRLRIVLIQPDRFAPTASAAVNDKRGTSSAIPAPWTRLIHAINKTTDDILMGYRLKIRRAKSPTLIGSLAGLDLVLAIVSRCGHRGGVFSPVTIPEIAEWMVLISL